MKRFSVAKILEHSNNDDYEFSPRQFNLLLKFRHAKIKQLENIDASSELLSIKILREYPNWNWELATLNRTITPFEIVDNKDLPWDIESIVKRGDFTTEMLRSMGIYFSTGNSPSHFDCQMAGFIKCTSIINEKMRKSTVEYSLEILKEKYPDYFGSNLDLNLLKLKISEQLREYGEFDLDCYEYPEEVFFGKNIDISIKIEKEFNPELLLKFEELYHYLIANSISEEDACVMCYLLAKKL